MLYALILTAGTALLMWIGDEITIKGLGNGMSLIIMAGIIKESDLPKEAVKEIGSTSSQRLNALISDIINMSIDKDDIYMSDKMYKCLNLLKDFMFERVYTDPYAKLEEVKARRMIERIKDLTTSFELVGESNRK